MTNGECQHCHKKGLEWDFAWGPGPSCRNPHIEDPAVGGWVCKYRPQDDDAQPLVAERVEAFACPVCRRLHLGGDFEGRTLMCRGCGNDISQGGCGDQRSERGE